MNARDVSTATGEKPAMEETLLQQVMPAIQKEVTLYRKSDVCIPRNETAWHCSQFLHSCIYERFIIFPGSVCLFGCSKISRPTMGIYKSPIDIWMLELGMRPRSFSSGNTHIGFSVQCVVEITRPQSFISGNISIGNQNQTFRLDSHRLFICNAVTSSQLRIRH